MDSVVTTSCAVQGAYEGMESVHVNRAAERCGGPKGPDRRGCSRIEGGTEPGLRGVSEGGRRARHAHSRVMGVVDAREACRGGLDHIDERVTKGRRARKGGAA